jgi:DNA-binding NtrC family response regulator
MISKEFVMRELGACVVVVANKTDVAYFEGLYGSAELPEEQIIRHVKDGNFRVVDLEASDEINLQPDLLIIEDRWEPAARLTCAASYCDEISSVVIVHSTVVMRSLLEKGLREPAAITLDFNLSELQSSPRWAQETSRLYQSIKGRWPLSYVIGITGYYITPDGTPHPDSASLVELLRRNGDDVYPKTPELDTFVHHLYRNAISSHKLRIDRKRNEELAESERKRADDSERVAKIERAARIVCGAPGLDECPEEPPTNDLVGSSEAMRYVYWAIEHYAKSEIPVHIVGETGTGKKLVAKAIHELSSRSKGVFGTIDCPTLQNADLLHSDIFGHLKGSFTDAKTDKKGLVQEAENGTVFFDDIDDLIPPGQGMLLRLLQERKGRKLGSTAEYNVNVRIISSSKVDLQEAAKKKRFKEDLVYRLFADSPIRLPALRDRQEDIPELLNHFLKLECRKQSKPFPTIETGAYQALRDYDWPGNVRQLEAMVLRMIALTDLTKPISADVARSFLPLVVVPLTERSINSGVDLLTELKLGNPRIVKRLYELEAAYIKAEAAQEGGKKKTPSLTDIGENCIPTITYSAISQFFKNHEKLIRQMSELGSDWPKLRNLSQWPH